MSQRHWSTLWNDKAYRSFYTDYSYTSPDFRQDYFRSPPRQLNFMGQHRDHIHLISSILILLGCGMLRIQVVLLYGVLVGLLRAFEWRLRTAATLAAFFACAIVLARIKAWGIDQAAIVPVIMGTVPLALGVTGFDLTG